MQEVEQSSLSSEIDYLRTPWTTSCLVFQGFIYNCHSAKPNGTKYWRCHNYSKKVKGERCKARCVLVNERVKTTAFRKDHNHAPHWEKIKKYKERERLLLVKQERGDVYGVN